MSALADTWRLRTTPRRGVDSFPWRGVRLLYRGSETPWGSGIPRGSGPPREVRSLRLFGLSACFFRNTWCSRTFPNQGTGPGPLSGEQGFRTAGVRLLDVVKDNYKAPFA